MFTLAGICVTTTCKGGALSVGHTVGIHMCAMPSPPVAVQMQPLPQEQAHLQPPEPHPQPLPQQQRRHHHSRPSIGVEGEQKKQAIDLFRLRGLS